MSSILGPVCQRLMGEALDEYKLVRGVKEEIKKLKFAVGVIKGVLEDAERKQEENSGVSTWLQSLKQILFDAEDVLDEIATDEAIRKMDAAGGTSKRAKVRNIIIRPLRPCGRIPHSRNMAHKMRDIRKRIDFISGGIDKLGLLIMLTGGISSSSDKLGLISGEIDNLRLVTSEGRIRPRTRPETISLLGDETHIFGRDVEKKQIEGLLVSEYSDEGSSTAGNVHVVVVVGMGGVGKTTLVKHVYNNSAVRQHFELTMWVCVSNDSDMKKIMQKIMEGVCASEEAKGFNEILNWDVAQTRLQDKIKGKRFLLVLDDVWEISHLDWDDLSKSLTCGGKGSKIVVTTRIQQLADVVKGTRIPLEGLSDEDLWAIFERYAFGNYFDPNKHRQLALVGRQIVKKLKGLPLATKTIGCLLSTKLDVNHWRNVLEEKAWLSIQSRKDSILEVLKLSYDYLPGHLKQCFVYCSIFPEDHQFDKHELVQLWTAQQFIEPHVKGNIFGDAECFDGLVHASLLEPYMDTGKYVMHDLIQNLAEKVSKGDCFRFDWKNFEGNSETIRHVYIDPWSFDSTKFSKLCKFENTRTLLFLHGTYGFQWDPHHLDELFTKLQRLRVLSLHHCCSGELPTSIDTLKHLRYLDFSFASISKLPESLCKLVNLQVLKLRGTEIKELPTSIGTLKHLRFLDISRTPISKLPEFLCNLLTLQVLDIRDCRDLRALPENMSALINLRHLYVNIRRNAYVKLDDDDNDDDRLLVSSIRGLSKLTALQELRFDCGRQKMGELADMDMLQQLKISSLEEVKSREEASESRLDKKGDLDKLTLTWSSDPRRVINNPGLDEEVLQSLQPASNSTCRRLTIEGYGGFRWPVWMDDQWWPSSSLERVELRRCTNWEVLPPLGQLPRLRFLEITGMDKVRRLGPQFMGRCCGYAEDGGGVVQVPGGGQFPRLDELQFRDMGEWEEWEAPPQGQEQQQRQQQLCRRQYDDDGRIIHNDGAEEDDDRLHRQKQPPQQQQQQPPQQIITYLPCLRKLVIRGCPKLRQLPPLPPTLTDLEISEVGLTHLPGWWGSPPSSSTLMSSPSSSPALSSLVIGACPNLTSLTDGLLPRLRSLEISRSSVLQMKAWLLQCPPSSLQELAIKDCPQLTGFGGTGGDDDVDGGSGESASLLETALVDRLAPALRHLKFWGCENLRSLPPNLRCLSSLESLELISCPQIQSLPAGGLPESLQDLSIFMCRLLWDRCMNGGPDSPLIRHVPRTSFY